MKQHNQFSFFLFGVFGRVLCVASLLALPSSASAARQYRCGGQIQYRPCGQELRTETRSYGPGAHFRRNRGATVHEPRGSLGQRYAEVTKQEYKAVGGGMGLWRGAFRGNGDIHLQLELILPDGAQDVRYMGHLPLRGNETTFNFKSMAPHGNNWRWKVTSWAR